MQNKKNNRGATYFFIIAIIGMLLFVLLSPGLSRNEKELTTDSEVFEYFKQDKVQEWELDLGTGKLRFRLRTDSDTWYSYSTSDPQYLRGKLDEYTEENNKDLPAQWEKIVFEVTTSSPLTYTEVIALFEQDEVREWKLDLSTGYLQFWLRGDTNKEYTLVHNDQQNLHDQLLAYTEGHNNNPESDREKIIYNVTTSLPNDEAPLTYFEVIGHFSRDRVREWKLDLNTGYLRFWLRSNENREYNFIYSDAESLKDELVAYTEEHNENLPVLREKVSYKTPTSTSIWEIVVNILPILAMAGLGVLLVVSMMRQSNQIGGVGRAKAKQISESDRTAVFDDVAGAEEEKEELLEIVEYLKEPKRFVQLGAKIPKGVLLVGPPGTGKTLLARAVAGEAGVPFYSISGSDFVELYVGVGASRVRDLFERAKKNCPSIIFIDEIDAVGRQRGAGLGGGHDEREQTLNQLLVELDGFIGNEGVIVMAATNRADVLDRALLRPGRFDRQIFVGYPDIKGREEILKVHARNKPLGPDVDLKTIAKTTPGFTGADLENLLNEGALLAARRRKKAITQEEIEEASVKVMMGPEKKSRVVTEKKRRIVAYHEAGHALAHYYVTPDKTVHQVSIIPRGAAGGYTMFRPNEDDDNTLVSKQDMTNEIITLLGGRVAERLILNDITTGASSDLERATTLARSMVTKYGFSETVGPVVYTQNEVFLGRDYTQSHTYSERIAGDIDDEVRAIIENAMRTCVDVLTEHLDKLHDVANALLERDKLDDEEFLQIMEAPKSIEAPEKDEKSAE